MGGLGKQIFICVMFVINIYFFLLVLLLFLFDFHFSTGKNFFWDKKYENNNFAFNNIFFLKK